MQEAVFLAAFITALGGLLILLTYLERSLEPGYHPTAPEHRDAVQAGLHRADRIDPGTDTESEADTGPNERRHSAS